MTKVRGWGGGRKMMKGGFAAHCPPLHTHLLLGGSGWKDVTRQVRARGHVTRRLVTRLVTARVITFPRREAGRRLSSFLTVSRHSSQTVQFIFVVMLMACVKQMMGGVLLNFNCYKYNLYNLYIQ